MAGLVSRSMWEQGLSAGSSLMFHLTALAVLAIFLVPSNHSSPSSVIQSEFVDTVVEEVSRIEPLALVDDSEAAPAPDRSVETLLTDISSEQPDTLSAAPVTDRASPFELSDVGLPAGSLSAAVGTGTGSSRQGDGSGSGTGLGGKGTGRGGDGFFGLTVKGKKTVFVVDASRSMNLPHPGVVRTRFNRVKLELVRTISSMTEKEQFFVVFFGDNALPMPARSLVEADADARKKYLNWVTRVQADGHTFPQQALLLALQLQPDLIYFLTDGEFDYSVVPGVSAANVRGIPIHTIGFNSNRAENLLREIASRNNGTYTYIPPDEVLPEDMKLPELKAGEKAFSIISLLGK